MKHWLLELAPLWIATVILWLAIGCTTRPIYQRLTDGAVEKGKAVCLFDLPIWTDSEIVPPAKDAIENARVADRIHYILAPGKREDKTFWVWLGAGALCLLIAIAMLVAAWMFSGWKRFGVGAAAFFGAGVAFSGFALSVQWFWIVPTAAAGIVAIGVAAWLLRNHKMMDARKAKPA